MEEKLTKTISIAKVKDAPEAQLSKPDLENDKFKAAATYILPTAAGKWTEEKLEDFADFIVTCRGMNYVQISEALGMASSYIYGVLKRHPSLREKIDQRNRAWYADQMTIMQQVMLEAATGADVPWTVKVAAAKDVMSRAGHDATTKVENTNKELVVELFDENKD